MFAGASNLLSKHKILRGVLILLAVGAAYYAFVKLTGLSLFCPIQKITGRACPGCGISHFCMDLVEFRFAEAFRENVAVAVLLPVWGVSAAAVYLKNGAQGFKKSRALNILAWVSVVLLVVFGVVRNLPGCEFLLPSYMQ